MKKVNINLILSLAVVIALLAVAAFLFCLGEQLNSDVIETTGNSMRETLDAGPVDDVEGYGLIAQGLGYGFALFGYIVLIVLALLVGGYALFMLFFVVLARAIYSNKRLLAYRILMGIVFALQIGLEVFLFSVLISDFAVWWLLIELILVGITVYCIINTYSSKIIDRKNLQMEPPKEVSQ